MIPVCNLGENYFGRSTGTDGENGKNHSMIKGEPYLDRDKME